MLSNINQSVMQKEVNSEKMTVKHIDTPHCWRIQVREENKVVELVHRCHFHLSYIDYTFI